MGGKSGWQSATYGSMVCAQQQVTCSWFHELSALLNIESNIAVEELSNKQMQLLFLMTGLYLNTRQEVLYSDSLKMDLHVDNLD